MMRPKIVAGNWKMNLSAAAAAELAGAICSQAGNYPATQIILSVPYPYIQLVSKLVSGIPNIFVAAQNSAAFQQGAYTGEVSAQMLESLGVSYCLTGHSERRSIFKEEAPELNNKMLLLHACGISPIWCCGETLEMRDKSLHFETVKRQMKNEIFTLSVLHLQKTIIAYEPVWAIGTGRTATAEQAQEMHAFIRESISEKFGEELAQKINILYGGSCNEQNALELFSKPDVDGGLIGGASLKAESFIKIIQAAHGLH